MYQGLTVTAVILAAGNSTRMKRKINKVYLDSNSNSIIQFSIAAFDQNTYVDDLVLIIRPEDTEQIQEILKTFPVKKSIKLISGGETRADSVYNGIRYLSSDISIIHDGARPVIKQDYINNCIEAMPDYYGAVIAMKTDEIICLRNEDNYIQYMKNQDSLYFAQTPQCFHTDILRKCHESVSDKEKITDDSSLLELAGYSVKILPGEKSNIKITTPEDFKLAEYYLSHYS